MSNSARRSPAKQLIEIVCGPMPSHVGLTKWYATSSNTVAPVLMLPTTRVGRPIFRPRRYCLPYSLSLSCNSGRSASSALPSISSPPSTLATFSRAAIRIARPTHANSSDTTDIAAATRMMGQAAPYSRRISKPKATRALDHAKVNFGTSARIFALSEMRLSASQPSVTAECSHAFSPGSRPASSSASRRPGSPAGAFPSAG